MEPVLYYMLFCFGILAVPGLFILLAVKWAERAEDPVQIQTESPLNPSPAAPSRPAIITSGVVPTSDEPQPSGVPTDESSRRRNARASGKAISQSIPDLSSVSEGRRKRKTNYAVVRNAKLRKAAIKIHGNNCCACGTNFDEKYGAELAKGFIEVHHLNSIATGERITDPATDLVPLCSNCHEMADRLSPPPRTISGLRNALFPASRLRGKEVIPSADAPKSPVQIKIGKIREKEPKNRS